MKEFGLIQKKDFILFFSLLVACALIFAFLLFSKKDGNTIVVQQNSEIIMELSLTDNGTYEIVDGEFYNKLIIEDGVAYVQDANCKDLVCVHHSAISKVNETITCLPHKLIIYVVGDNVSEIDAVVN